MHWNVEYDEGGELIDNNPNLHRHSYSCSEGHIFTHHLKSGRQWFEFEDNLVATHCGFGGV